MLWREILSYGDPEDGLKIAVGAFA